MHQDLNKSDSYERSGLKEKICLSVTKFRQIKLGFLLLFFPKSSLLCTLVCLVVRVSGGCLRRWEWRGARLRCEGLERLLTKEGLLERKCVVKVYRKFRIGESIW